MRIKLFNGSIPGFTDAEIAQRQAQSAADAAGRVGTGQSMSAPLMQTPMNNITPPSQTPTGPNVNVATGSGSGEGINSLPQSGTLDEENYTLAQALKDQQADGPIIEGISGVDVSGNVNDALKYEDEYEDGDPMLTRYGIEQADFDKMTIDQQDNLFAQMEYANQYGAEPQTQSMILQERGIDPSQYMKADGSYDRLALTQAKLKSDIQEAIDDGYLPEITLTGNESFQDLVDLDKQYMDAVMKEIYSTPAYTAPVYNQGTETAGTKPSVEELTMSFDPETRSEARKQLHGGPPSGMNQGGRVNLRTGGDAVKFGSYLKTKNPKIKTTKNNKHEQLLRLLKQKQSRKLMSSLKKNLTNLNKSKNTSNANSKTISSAMKRLEALKKFYGRS